MKLVVIESPYAGSVDRNIIYARRAMRDSLMRGEAPLASHLLYTQEGILDDKLRQERRAGIEAGFAWALKASAAVFYMDYGTSPGMAEAMDHYRKVGNIEVLYRTIGLNPDAQAH